MSADYYLRLSVEQLRQLDFHHLGSGVDEDEPADLDPVSAEGACKTSPMAGFTEWATAAAPRCSIGWDWVAQGSAAALGVRPHSIRTNIMLLTPQGDDAGRQATEAAITELIATWSWPAVVLAALTVQSS